MRRGTLSEIKPMRMFSLLFLAMALFFTACEDDDSELPTEEIEEPTGDLTVENQFVAETNNSILINQVRLSDPGWLLVHRDDGSGQAGSGQPDEQQVISEPLYVEAGTHEDLMLPINEDEEVGINERVWVVLHLDTGEEGVFEYDGLPEGDDPPILDPSGNPVRDSFLNNPTYSEDTEQTTYLIEEVDGSGISGTATFYPAARGEGAYVVLNLDGTPPEGDHPAHIHVNTAEEGGGIAISLENVEGATGESVSFIDRFDDNSPERAGEAVTYAELQEFDGHINVHESPENLSNIVAQGDIGQNSSPLSGRERVYELTAGNVEGVTGGTARVMELEDGTSVVHLQVEGTQEGVNLPAEIRRGTVAEGGDEVLATLNEVHGRSGQSFTRLSSWDDGTAVTFDELENADAYLNVYRAADAPEPRSIAVQADIGENELTGESQVFQIDPAEGSEVGGTLTLSERRGGGTLAEWELENVPEGTTFDAGIFHGAIGEGGERAIGLNQVRGGADNIGRSATSIRAFDAADGAVGGGAPVTYSQLGEFDGHAAVQGPGGTGVAAGAIGTAAAQ